MEPATWKNCRAEFAYDRSQGAFNDLVAPGTGPAEWEAFWSALGAGPFEVQAYRDGEPIPLPESARWVFSHREEASYSLSISAGNVSAGCTFNEYDLKLHIDPRGVVGESEFESVLAIMRFVAAAVRLPVFAVTEGGSAEHAFVRVTPDGQAEFLPRRSVRPGCARLWRCSIAFPRANRSR
jgi:hypothetical protein